MSDEKMMRRFIEVDMAVDELLHVTHTSGHIFSDRVASHEELAKAEALVAELNAEFGCSYELPEWAYLGPGQSTEFGEYREPGDGLIHLGEDDGQATLRMSEMPPQ